MRALDCGLIEVGRAAGFRRHHVTRPSYSAGKNILDSVQLGDLPGIGMTIIDGIVRTQPAEMRAGHREVPEITLLTAMMSRCNFL